MTLELTPVTLGTDSTNIQKNVSLYNLAYRLKIVLQSILDDIAPDYTHVGYYAITNTFIFQLIDLLAHNTLFNPMLCPG